MDIAQQQRPDIIELKLILEADQQRLILAENEARPDLNTSMLYRWNGLSGEVPGAIVRSGAGQLTDWGVSVNFSVPFGLRAGRAGVRRQELTIARDRANLEQGLHAMTHLLALNLRNLDQFFEQYGAIREVRDAATQNLVQQAAEFKSGRTIFLNVLQAITDWGNSVSNEARALALYNIELANIERATGTILDTHGVRFFEERFAAIGPLGERRPRCYPAQARPSPNTDRYTDGDKPAEESFNLTPPIRSRAQEGEDEWLRANPPDVPPREKPPSQSLPPPSPDAPARSSGAPPIRFPR